MFLKITTATIVLKSRMSAKDNNSEESLEAHQLTSMSLELEGYT